MQKVALRLDIIVLLILGFIAFYLGKRAHIRQMTL